MISEHDCWFLSQDVQILLPVKEDITQNVGKKYICIKDNNKQLPYQNVLVEEAKQLFLKHVNQVIFKEIKQRTLKGLIDNYHNILMNHNYQSTSNYKSDDSERIR